MSGKLPWFRIEGTYPRAGVSGPWVVQAQSASAARRHAEALGIVVVAVTPAEPPEEESASWALSSGLVLLEKSSLSPTPGRAFTNPLPSFSPAMCPCGQTESLVRVRRSLRRWSLPLLSGLSTAGTFYAYLCPQCAAYQAYEERRKLLNRVGCLVLAALTLAGLALFLLA